MSRVRADEIANRLNTGCPDLVHGAVITGVCSATTFVGGLTGDATGLSGTPNISVANIQAGIVTFTGDLSVGGTITHEDVTNIDSVGIVTGRLGYNVVSSGASIFSPATNVLTLGTQAEERARIDADGKLLIGTTTEGAGAADDLTVASSGNCGITIRSGTTSTGNLYFSDATSGAGEYDGFIEHNWGENTLNSNLQQKKELIEQFDTLHVCNCGGVSCPPERRGYRESIGKEKLETPPCDCNCFNLLHK